MWGGQNDERPRKGQNGCLLQTEKLLLDPCTTFWSSLLVAFPRNFYAKQKSLQLFLRLMTKKNILTKDNLLRRGWKGSSVAFSVDKMNLLIIYSFNALLLDWFGVLWKVLLPLIPPVLICLSILESGLKAFRNLIDNWCWWGLLQCSGWFGDAAIALFLKEESSLIPWLWSNWSAFGTWIGLSCR